MKVKKKTPKQSKQLKGTLRKPNWIDGKLAPGGASLNPAGRPKGVPNKFTTLKAAFIEAFNRMGGVERLESWAEEDPRNTKVFYTLLARMLPREVVVAGTDDVTPNNLRGLKDEELDAILLGHLKDA